MENKEHISKGATKVDNVEGHNNIDCEGIDITRTVTEDRSLTKIRQIQGCQ